MMSKASVQAKLKDISYKTRQDLNWAAQQVRQKGKPAGNIAKYNQEARQILRAAGLTSREVLSAMRTKPLKVVRLTKRPKKLPQLATTYARQTAHGLENAGFVWRKRFNYKPDAQKLAARYRAKGNLARVVGSVSRWDVYSKKK